MIALEEAPSANPDLRLSAFDWPEPPEVFRDTARVVGVPIHLCGVTLERGGECISGSAASLDVDPMPRALFELFERVALVDAMREAPERLVVFDVARRPIAVVPAARVFPVNQEPSRIRWARSNGVAAGVGWADAARRARLELVERDRVLRSWLGQLRPVPCEHPAGVPEAIREAYDFHCYSFGEPPDMAAGVFAFPPDGQPLSYGFAARDTREASLAAATAECLQRLGFLYGEAIPDVVPEASPTPDFHQEYFLFPPHRERIERWLRGEHARFAVASGGLRTVKDPVYVDLTPRLARSDIAVVKALPRGHIPLAFGFGGCSVGEGLPSALAVHPIA